MAHQPPANQADGKPADAEAVDSWYRAIWLKLRGETDSGTFHVSAKFWGEEGIIALDDASMWYGASG